MWSRAIPCRYPYVLSGYYMRVPIGPEESKAIKGEGKKGLGI
jgi:hypothetical protein